MKSLAIFFLLTTSVFARDVRFDCYPENSRKKVEINISSTNDFTLLFPYQIDLRFQSKRIMGFGQTQGGQFEEKLLVFKNLLTIQEEILDLNIGSSVKLKTLIKNFETLDCRVSKNLKYAWN